MPIHGDNVTEYSQCIFDGEYGKVPVKAGETELTFPQTFCIIIGESNAR
jgi:hypothetical protein